MPETTQRTSTTNLNQQLKDAGKPHGHRLTHCEIAGIGLCWWTVYQTWLGMGLAWAWHGLRLTTTLVTTNRPRLVIFPRTGKKNLVHPTLQLRLPTCHLRCCRSRHICRWFWDTILFLCSFLASAPCKSDWKQDNMNANFRGYPTDRNLSVPVGENDVLKDYRRY